MLRWTDGLFAARDDDLQKFRRIIQLPRRRDRLDVGLVRSRGDDDGDARQTIIHAARAKVESDRFKVQNALVFISGPKLAA